MIHKHFIQEATQAHLYLPVEPRPRLLKRLGCVLATSKVDFSNQQMSDKYDSVLLKLYNENDKDLALLSESLSALPIKAKRVALKRLHSKEFEQFKRVKIRRKWSVGQDRQPLIKTWHWILIFLGLAAIALTQSD